MARVGTPTKAKTATQKRSASTSKQRHAKAAPSTKAAGESSQVKAPEQDHLTISLDFGTSESCIGLLFEADKPVDAKLLKDVLKAAHVITQWGSGSSGGTMEKPSVDTATMYPKNGPANKVFWGFQVMNHFTDMEDAAHIEPGTMDIVRYSKLLLHSSSVSKEKVERIKKIATRRGVPSLSFCQDFLDALFMFLLGNKGFVKTFFPGKKKSNISLIVGCPPAWNDTETEELLKMAQLALRKAREAGGTRAQESGMEKVFLASEAEAIMLFYASHNEDSFKVDQKWMVADGGGATFDLVLYTVTSIHPLRLAECCVADSVLCGGVFLDEKLRFVVKERYFKKSVETDDIEYDLDWAARHFEKNVKRRFGEDEPIDFVAKLPKTGTKVLITYHDLKVRVFDPAIRDMKHAMKVMFDRTEEMRKGCNDQRVIFAGGVFQNEYLMGRVEAWFASEDALKKIKTLRIQSSMAPNAQGLLLIDPGNKGIVQHRTTKTIGLFNIDYYNEATHGSEFSSGAYLDGGLKLVNEIIWVVRRNDLVPESFEHRRKRTNVIGADVEVMREVVYISDSSPPPNQESSLLPDDDSEEILKQGMNMVAIDITWSLDDIRKAAHFHQAESTDGNVAYRVNWDIVIRFVGNRLLLSVDLKSKTDEVLSTSGQPLTIDLNAEAKNYISLGSLTTRHERKLQIEAGKN